MKTTILRVLLLATLIMLVGGNAGATGSSGWPKIYSHGPRDGKYVALTFDDAPRSTTVQLLDILGNLDVPATFFVEGLFASREPDSLLEIAKRGFEIGNHSYNHPDMKLVTDDVRRTELQSTNDIICRIAGITPYLFRPPGGSYNARVADIAFGKDMTTVLWTVQCGDYKEPTRDFIVNRVLSLTRPGAIILLHDGLENTREAVPEIVNTLRNRGYTFVTVGQMLEMTNGQCQWQSYYDDKVQYETLPPVF